MQRQWREKHSILSPLSCRQLSSVTLVYCTNTLNDLLYWLSQSEIFILMSNLHSDSRSQREKLTYLPLGEDCPVCSDSQRRQLLSAEGAVNKARHYTKNRTRVRMRAGSIPGRHCTTPQPECRYKHNFQR